MKLSSTPLLLALAFPFASCAAAKVSTSAQVVHVVEASGGSS